MTDIIPKAASGRYMGLSNVVTASSTTIAVAIGGLTMDAVNRALGVGAGTADRDARFGIIYFLLGALALRPVVEPIAAVRDAPAAAATPAAPGTP